MQSFLFRVFLFDSRMALCGTFIFYLDCCSLFITASLANFILLNQALDLWTRHHLLEIIVTNAQKFGCKIWMLRCVSALCWHEVCLTSLFYLAMEHLTKPKLLSSNDVTHRAADILYLRDLVAEGALALWPHIILLQLHKFFHAHAPLNDKIKMVHVLVALLYDDFIWKILAQLRLAHAAGGQVLNVLSAETGQE